MATLERALDGVAAFDATYVIAVANVVESEPWGVTDQPAFANTVARVDTAIPADRLLVALKELEAELGRTAGVRYGPRVIDIDVLLYGDEEWQSPGLVIPHPRLAERDFVVTPLLEIAPAVQWPDGSAITRERAREGRVTRVIGPVPGYEDRTPLPTRTPGAPAGEESWEQVASSQFNVAGGLTYATQLRFEASVLEQEGIPIAWDPLPPAEEYNLYLLPRTYRLLVPSRYADRARALLDEIRSAPAVIDEDDLRGGPEGA
jgi:2-amino-4-hydroxy-6-hydroxymethyldihydropteridine diphosphokinase